MATQRPFELNSEPTAEIEPKTKRRYAPRYRVLLHDDDKTPMEFVVEMLQAKFRKPEAEAVELMLRAHHKGIAYVDTLPLEQAEFRVSQVHSLARSRRFPLTLTYEPEE